VLVAAAEAGLPQTLADHMAQGMDLATASSLTESAFAARTPFTQEACRWVVAELAVALGLAPSAPAGTPGVPPRTPGVPAGSPGAGQQATAPEASPVRPAPGPPRPDNAETQLPYQAGPASPGWYGPPPGGARPGPAGPAAGRPGGTGPPPWTRPRPMMVPKVRPVPGWVYLIGALVALLVIAAIMAAAAHHGPGRSIGHEGWHTRHDPAYHAVRGDQTLECYTDPQVNGLFPYLWTLPSQRVILVAGDSVAGASYTGRQDWREKLTYG